MTVSYSQTKPEPKTLINGKLFSRTEVIHYDKNHDPYYKVTFYFQDSVGVYQEIYCQNYPRYSTGLKFSNHLPDSIYGVPDTIHYTPGTWTKKGDSRKTTRQRMKGTYKGADSVFTRISRRPIETKLKNYKNFLINNGFVDTFYVDNSDVYPQGMNPWNQRDSIVCEYYKEKKHGTEVGYFSNKVIQESCSKPPFIKYHGTWNNDLKHGKWVYYSTLGEVTSWEKYKQGKLIKRSF